MENLVIVRGGGDLATGTIYKLYKCGLKLLILETENPSAIRRNVAFCEAVYLGRQTVEDVTCYLAENIEEAVGMLKAGKLVMLVDPKAESISKLQPFAVIDGILAKKNLGTHKGMAPITIALGPGFTAGANNVKNEMPDVMSIEMSEKEPDVDAVIETKRGHSLGRVIYQGTAIRNTGIPGEIAGISKERVIHSPSDGIIRHVKKITDFVKKGEIIAEIEHNSMVIPVYATIDGILRGLIREEFPVTCGLKIADIDPRMEEYENCFTISDKARCIAGGVLEAILYLKYKKGL